MGVGRGAVTGIGLSFVSGEDGLLGVISTVGLGIVEAGVGVITTTGLGVAVGAGVGVATTAGLGVTVGTGVGVAMATEGKGVAVTTGVAVGLTEGVGVTTEGVPEPPKRIAIARAMIRAPQRIAPIISPRFGGGAPGGEGGSTDGVEVVDEDTGTPVGRPAAAMVSCKTFQNS
jgi:hypothetical protein